MAEIYESPLRALRKQLIERIQARSREAREQVVGDVQEGATTEPTAAPQQVAAPGNPLLFPEDQEEEFQEIEA